MQRVRRPYRQQADFCGETERHVVVSSMVFTRLGGQIECAIRTKKWGVFVAV